MPKTSLNCPGVKQSTLFNRRTRTELTGSTTALIPFVSRSPATESSSGSDSHHHPSSHLPVHAIKSADRKTQQWFQLFARLYQDKPFAMKAFESIPAYGSGYLKQSFQYYKNEVPGPVKYVLHHLVRHVFPFTKPFYLFLLLSQLPFVAAQNCSYTVVSGAPEGNEEVCDEIRELDPSNSQTKDCDEFHILDSTNQVAAQFARVIKEDLFFGDGSVEAAQDNVVLSCFDDDRFKSFMQTLVCDPNKINGSEAFIAYDSTGEETCLGSYPIGDSNLQVRVWGMSESACNTVRANFTDIADNCNDTSDVLAYLAILYGSIAGGICCIGLLGIVCMAVIICVAVLVIGCGAGIIGTGYGCLLVADWAAEHSRNAYDQMRNLGRQVSNHIDQASHDAREWSSHQLHRLTHPSCLGGNHDESDTNSVAEATSDIEMEDIETGRTSSSRHSIFSDTQSDSTQSSAHSSSEQDKAIDSEDSASDSSVHPL